MRRKKPVMITISTRPQTSDEEQQFRTLLDAVIRDIAKKMIQEWKERNGNEQPIGPPLHRFCQMQHTGAKEGELPPAGGVAP